VTLYKPVSKSGRGNYHGGLLGLLYELKLRVGEEPTVEVCSACEAFGREASDASKFKNFGDRFSAPHLGRYSGVEGEMLAEIALRDVVILLLGRPSPVAPSWHHAFRRSDGSPQLPFAAS
jgi:hypothetical protein